MPEGIPSETEPKYEMKGTTLRVRPTGLLYEAGVEDSEQCMAQVVDALAKNKDAQTVAVVGAREYEYSVAETAMLKEVATVIEEVVRNRNLLTVHLLGEYRDYVADEFAYVQALVLTKLQGDPIGVYVDLRRRMRHINVRVRSVSGKRTEAYQLLTDSILVPILQVIENTALMKAAKQHLTTHKMGDRSVYRQIFHPTVRPVFMQTRYQTELPEAAEVVDRYSLRDGVEVEIYKAKGSVRYVYHVIPPEFRLSEDHYTILDAARRYMIEHKPREIEFADPERMREVFYNIGRDLLVDIANQVGVTLTREELERLSSILTRYTAGLGVLEIILSDERVQDVFINSPIGSNPIYIFHQDFQECVTNFIPTQEDAEYWATRFRLSSGRPLDEANPVLDTEVTVPGGRARVAIITRTLSPQGLGFALRRHRDDPWTYPLFIQPKIGYFNDLFAGLMSFIIDYSRTFLIAGTRSSGKTSLLNASLLEIMRKYRIVTVEDSVTGDSEMLVERNGRVEKTTIGTLVDGLFQKYGHNMLASGHERLDNNLPEKLRVYSMDNEGKIRLSTPSSFIRHSTTKDLYEVKTSTGRKLKVTGDHSLFTLSDNGKITEIKTNELRPGSRIAVPRTLPLENKPITKMELFDKITKGFVTSPRVATSIQAQRREVLLLAAEMSYSKSAVQHWCRGNVLPIEVYRLLPESIRKSIGDVKIKPVAQAKAIVHDITMDKTFLEFLGMWLADGCYDKKSVLVSVVEDELREVVRTIAARFDASCKMHSDGVTLMINSATLRYVLKELLGFSGNAYTKQIPPWIFGLSKDQIGAFLRGLFSGDGYATDYEVGLSLTSEGIINDVQTLLLSLGVVSRKKNMVKRDKTYPLRINGIPMVRAFEQNVSFLQEKKTARLHTACSRRFTHNISDTVPLSLADKQALSVLSGFNKNDYIERGNQIGRNKLTALLASPDVASLGDLAVSMNKLASSDIFWDVVEEVNVLKNEERYVYDLSVPGDESFVCQNIVAHNTLEIPVNKLRNLGFNIESLKSRSVITQVETELPADEAIRTSLRLGDSVLIIGEVRSLEGKALYEAMRIGALANTVAGTIHGDSPYGVFDRVVNDLNVPATSFKATDIIIVCNLMKSADGLRRFRRVTSVTEVRKHWREDPQAEGGFVPLLQYSSREDILKPTDTLLNGESFILNEIAQSVREWAGNWNDVWENIQLRAKIKKTIAEYGAAHKPQIMEAPFVVEANDAFHLISEQLRNEVGTIPTDRAYEMWYDWFKKQVKR